MRALPFPETSTPTHQPDLIDELAKVIADAALDKMLSDVAPADAETPEARS